MRGNRGVYSELRVSTDCPGAELNFCTPDYSRWITSDIAENSRTHLAGRHPELPAYEQSGYGGHLQPV